MWLVLGDTYDASARWMFEGLRARGLRPVELLTANQLALSDFQEHRVEAGCTSLRFRTEAGLQVDGRQLAGVFNRLYSVPVAHWRQASKVDQEYVQQELIAFFLSWLHALPCPVLNRPTPQGLCGQWRQESEWAWLARQAGLPVPAYRQHSSQRIDETRGERRLVPAGAAISRVVVAGKRVFGPPMSPQLAAGCVRLAALADTHLLGVDFFDDAAAGVRFAGANPTPDLRVGGEALIDALARDLSEQREAA